MKKFMKCSGILGAIGLLGSVVFKLFHLMGAPTLLLIGTIGVGLYVLLFALQKIFEKVH